MRNAKGGVCRPLGLHDLIAMRLQFPLEIGDLLPQASHLAGLGNTLPPEHYSEHGGGQSQSGKQRSVLDQVVTEVVHGWASGRSDAATGLYATLPTPALQASACKTGPD
jgi:hypothetical protein